MSRFRHRRRRYRRHYGRSFNGNRHPAFKINLLGFRVSLSWLSLILTGLSLFLFTGIGNKIKNLFGRS